MPANLSRSARLGTTGRRRRTPFGDRRIHFGVRSGSFATSFSLQRVSRIHEGAYGRHGSRWTKRLSLARALRC